MKFSSMIIAIAVLSLFTAIAFAAPAPPTGVTAVDYPDDNGGNISITWTKSDDDGEGGNNVTKYDILRATSLGGTYDLIGNTSSGEVSYTDNNTHDGDDYYYKVNASDGVNSSSSDPEGPVQSKENIRPVISLVKNGTVDDVSAEITWTTDEAATSRVEYDNVSSSYKHSEEDSLFVKEHSLTITGLNASTTYYYRVNSTDKAGNSNESEEKNFTTASDTTVDNIKPTVNETNPGNVGTGIDITANITAKFSEYMNESTLNTTSFLLKNSSSPISGGVSYDDSTKIATFNPTKNLDYGTNYTATLTTGVTDLAGNSLDETTWSFTTELKETSNTAPKAKNNSVNPTIGVVTSATFYFYVTFTDDDNDELKSVKLHTDGNVFDMKEVDSSDEKTDDGKKYVYNTTFSKVGTYKYNFTASDNDTTGKSSTKEFEVHSATYYSGNRIWVEDTGMSDETYTWNPPVFLYHLRCRYRRADLRS